MACCGKAKKLKEIQKRRERMAKLKRLNLPKKKRRKK
jgi:hypothetical protein